MKKNIILALILGAIMLMTACVEHEEIDFVGVVVGGRGCTSSVYDSNMGYVVQLSLPTGVGGSLTSSDGHEMKNLVVLYQPGMRIMVGDRIHGKFYFDEKYSRSNCTIRWDAELPEGVFTEVYVN